MKTRELENLNVPHGSAMQQAKTLCMRAADAGLSKESIRELVRSAVANPEGFRLDALAGPFAESLLAHARDTSLFVPREKPAPWKSWGVDLEPESVNQMARACDLPVAVAGALMPDAHVGYGLPIGGVLATENAVVPYAVGVDIACRMRLSVLDMPVDLLDSEQGREHLTAAIERETRFGVGGSFKQPRNHDVMDADWSVSPVTSTNKSKAWSQLGTSGSGNHFVEFGMLTVDESAAPSRENPAHSFSDHGSGWNFKLEPGRYLALLSHSGSRGTGAAVCDRYSRIARELHPELPKELSYLAWLDMNSQPGQEYWHAMNLMGQYASANHECIHSHIIRHLGAKAIAYVENHHNFAWKEVHDPGDGKGPRELIVHRKGATPAGTGVLGVIPGSMAAPGFVVRGRGGAESLRSASHGAGRVMSRTKARDTFAWGNVRRDLEAKNVHVISAGIDEVPGVYKDIHAVMRQQQDLVEAIARFDPRLVKMAPEGEKAED
jgi:tRNA-splicing ligase RtcB (3'-phosphate/5'-hydroxy nucleic acid ligase)